jgi:hypothetical protein
MSLTVTKSGMLCFNGTHFYTLEQIHQKLLEASNPGLTTNCPEGGRFPTIQRASNFATDDEEPLPLPSMAPPKQEHRPPPKQVFNSADDEEVLELPSTAK